MPNPNRRMQMLQRQLQQIQRQLQNAAAPRQGVPQGRRQQRQAARQGVPAQVTPAIVGQRVVNQLGKAGGLVRNMVYRNAHGHTADAIVGAMGTKAPLVSAVLDAIDRLQAAEATPVAVQVAPVTSTAAPVATAPATPVATVTPTSGQ